MASQNTPQSQGNIKQTQSSTSTPKEDVYNKQRVFVEDESQVFEHRCAIEHSYFFKDKIRAADRAFNKLVLVSIISFIFCITEAVGGYWSGSLAIMTDAAHQLSDVAGFVISFIAICLTKKRATLKYSFGYHRADVLGALASVLIIWLLLVWLLAEAVQRLLNPDLIDVDGFIMLITACIGLGCNIANLIVLNFCCNSKGEKITKEKVFDSIASAYAYKPLHGRYYGASRTKSIAADDDVASQRSKSNASISNNNQKQVDMDYTTNVSKPLLMVSQDSQAIPSRLNDTSDRRTLTKKESDNTNSVEPMSPAAKAQSSRSTTGKDDDIKEDLEVAKIGRGKSQDNMVIEEVDERDIESQHGDDESDDDDDRENMNVRAAVIHMLGDMVQSLGVIAAAVIIYVKPEWKIADPICTFLFSILVMLTTVPIFGDCMRIILETSPQDIEVHEVFNAIQDMPYVCELHDFHLWNISDEKAILTAHIVSDYNPSFVLYSVTQMLQKEFKIYHTTIQIEPMKETHLKGGLKDKKGLLRCINEHNFVDKRKIRASKKES